VVLSTDIYINNTKVGKFSSTIGERRGERGEEKRGNLLLLKTNKYEFAYLGNLPCEENILFFYILHTEITHKNKEI
jgi:hypothetical protein